MVNIQANTLITGRAVRRSGRGSSSCYQNVGYDGEGPSAKWIFIGTPLLAVGTFIGCHYDRKAEVKDVKCDNMEMTYNEKDMFIRARNLSYSFEGWMGEHPELDINLQNNAGQTVLMMLLSDLTTENEPCTSFKTRRAHFILENYVKELDYSIRDNEGKGYQDYLNKVETSSNFKEFCREEWFVKNFDEVKKMIKEGAIKQHKEEVRGKARSKTSYAFYEMMAQAKESKRG